MQVIPIIGMTTAITTGTIAMILVSVVMVMDSETMATEMDLTMEEIILATILEMMDSDSATTAITMEVVAISDSAVCLETTAIMEEVDLVH